MSTNVHTGYFSEYSDEEVINLARRQYEVLKVFEVELARRGVKRYFYHTSAWAETKDQPKEKK